MTSNRILNAYTWVFLIFMFTPLLLTVGSSFTDVSPLSVTAWRCPLGKWYASFWLDDSSLCAPRVPRSSACALCGSLFVTL